MRDIPTELIAEFRKTANPEAAIWFFRIPYGDSDELRLVKNTEDIPDFGGDYYQAWNIEHQGFVVSDEEDQSGSVTLRITNATTTLKSLLETYKDFMDHTVHVKVGHASYLTEGYAVDMGRWQIVDSDVIGTTVEWQLGRIDQHSRMVPERPFGPDSCGHDFGGPVCGFPKDWFGDDELQAANIVVRKWRTCDLGYGSRNGCVLKGKLAKKMGIECHWPRRFGGQRGIRKPRN